MLPDRVSNPGPLTYELQKGRIVMGRGEGREVEELLNNGHLL